MARARTLLPLVLLVGLLAFPARSSGAPAPVRFIVGFNEYSGAKQSVEDAGGQPVLELPKHRAIAAKLTPEAYDRLRRNHRVRYIERDPRRYLLAQTTPYGITMVQANKLESPKPGAIRVCVIDSGYYLEHRDLPTNAITGDSDPSAGEWFKDGSGHGTHVAGTIAAMDNTRGVVGVHPGRNVKLHIVRVFGDDGEWAYSSTLVAALDKCVAAESKVVSMSLGGAPPSTTENDAFQAAYDAGVLLVASAGNDGTNELHYPASYESVISVGAVDSDKVVADFSQKNSDVELAAPGVAVLSTVPWIETNTLSADGVTWNGNHLHGSARTSGITGELVDGDRCTADGPWSGKVVLCERGDIPFAEKVAHAEASGAVAVVIYNNVPGPFRGTMGESSSSLPAVTLSQEDGLAALGHVGSPGTVVSLLEQPASGYEEFSGTSMSAPHVSGVAALVWSFNPSWTNVQIRTALQMGAMDLGDPGRDPSYGFGLVQAKAAFCYLRPNRPRC